MGKGRRNGWMDDSINKRIEGGRKEGVNGGREGGRQESMDYE